MAWFDDLGLVQQGAAYLVGSTVLACVYGSYWRLGQILETLKLIAQLLAKSDLDRL